MDRYRGRGENMNVMKKGNGAETHREGNQFRTRGAHVEFSLVAKFILGVLASERKWPFPTRI